MLLLIHIRPVICIVQVFQWITGRESVAEGPRVPLGIGLGQEPALAGGEGKALVELEVVEAALDHLPPNLELRHP